MKRTIIIMLIAMLVGGVLISCSNEMRSKESWYSISVSAASEKALSTNASNLTEVSVDSLHWYYSAAKTSGPFTHGKTEFSAVKEGTGLADANLGQFSNGGWTFVFKGYLEEVGKAVFLGTSEGAKPVYECTTTFTLSADLDLELVLQEGEGMPGNGFKLGVVEIEASDLAYPLTSTLSIYEGEALLLGPVSTFEDEGIDQNGKIHFKSDEVVPLSVGAHTLTFKVVSDTREEETETIGSEPIILNVAKGVTQTLGGSIDAADGQSAITVTAFSNIYKVTFNVNGGDALEASWKNVYSGQTYGELPTPTKTDDTFAGWYTAQTGGTLVTAESDVAINDNHTLYAHWGVASNILSLSLPPGFEAYAKIFVDNEEVSVCEVETAATKWGDLDGQTYAASWDMYSNGEVVDSFTVTGFSVLTFNVEGDEVDFLSLPSTSTGNGKAYLWVCNESGDPVALDADIDFTKIYYVTPTEYMPVASSLTIRTPDAEEMIFRVNGEDLEAVEIDITGATTFGDLVGRLCGIAFIFEPGTEDETTYSGYEYGTYAFPDYDVFCAMTKGQFGEELEDAPIPVVTSDVEVPGYADITPVLSTDEIDTSKYYFFFPSVG